MMLKQLMLAVCLMLPVAAMSADEAASRYVEYVELQPPFITNYGGPGPLKYLKAEVSLKVTSRDAEVNIKLHQPPIRNNLVLLLSQQTDDTVSTAIGREQIRLQALEGIRQIMVEEYGQESYDTVADLLFTSFVVQK